MQIKLADGTNKTLGIIDLAGFIKEMLLDKPNKSQNFRSLATNLGEDDFLTFVDYCNKQKKWAIEKRINKLEWEIEALQEDLKEEQKKEPAKKKK